jgi:hypothetical protein
MIQSIQLEKAIDVFDLFSFLDEYQVDYVPEGKNIGRGYVGVRPCPGCGDMRNHFGIHIEKKFATCFKCKFGMNTVYIVKYYAHLKTFDEAEQFLIDKLDEGDYDLVTRVTDIIRSEKKESQYIPLKKDPFPTDTYPITNKILKRNKYIRKFFKDRKLFLWHVKRYDLRIGGVHSDYSGYILFPIYLRNKIVTWQARQILSKLYHNPENLGSYIYNEDYILNNQPLILVEGVLDMIRVDSYLKIYYPNSISVTTGCVKMISKKQIQNIINCRPSKVIVMFDADSWFDYTRIKQEIPVDVDFVILPKGKDPNDLSWSELHSVFGEINEQSRIRKNINVESYNKDKHLSKM